mmetsp:Transcript_15828/g.51856  ORF Transcript_15828/g.51856 Transcript_15828/m.51856 type:complete len:564 (+) Transcript_15828:3-1694(+)
MIASRAALSGSSLRLRSARARLQHRSSVSAEPRAVSDAASEAAGGRSHETDVVVIGAGIGGLCAGALLAHYGYSVTVCESHTVPGGAAHAWERDGYTFESGPSLYSGMEARPTTNPIGQVLHALGEDLPCINYNTWHVHLPEGSFITEVGSSQWQECLTKYVDDEAVQEWEKLLERMKPLAAASTSMPTIAIRPDAAVLLTLAAFVPKLVGVPLDMLPRITKPYSSFLDDAGINHPFIRNWMDLLCFLLSGKPANATMAAEIGYMFNDWYTPGAQLEFPKGGSGAIIDALVRGLKKNGGKLLTSAHVEEILVSDGRATGVSLRGGARIGARTAVVSNATLWDTVPLLPEGTMPKEWVEEAEGVPQLESFMHLHLGIDATDLPDDLEIHHAWVGDWSKGVDAEQNLVLVSIPSVLDPSLAPPGKHVIHAYTPGNEPMALWDGLDRKSDEYKKLKEERSRVLWEAVEKAIPDVRKRVEIEMVGTPLTCARFLRRKRGSYGGFGWISDEGLTAFPSAQTPLEGLLVVGDTNFPGPGVPSVAAGGAAVAHSIAPVWQHLKTLNTVTP